MDGNRIRRQKGSTITRSYFPVYEEENGTTIKYYVFNGMRVAVKRGSSLSYLHADHLSSTSLTTNTGGNETASRGYYAYGATRSSSGTLPTDRTFTGQKSDGTGLLYYNARYYDPALGTFLSPDTIVPDAGAVIDYNRFLYVRGNPLKFSDPRGHNPACMNLGFVPLIGPAAGSLCQVGNLVVQYGPQAVQLAQQWADKVPAVTDWLLSVGKQSGNTPPSAPQGGGNTAGPGGWDPNKFKGIFRNAGERYQYQTSGTTFGQETTLNLTRNGIRTTVDVDGISGGFLHESKFLDPNSSFYDKTIGRLGTGMKLHVQGWRNELERLSLAAQQNGYNGVKVFTNSQQAISTAQELFGNEEWFKSIQFIHEVPK